MSNHILIDTLTRQAEWWLDETGLLNPTYGLGDIETCYGLYDGADGVQIADPDDKPDFETRANFCLLIAAVLESEQ